MVVSLARRPGKIFLKAQLTCRRPPRARLTAHRDRSISLGPGSISLPPVNRASTRARMSATWPIYPTVSSSTSATQPAFRSTSARATRQTSISRMTAQQARRHATRLHPAAARLHRGCRLRKVLSVAPRQARRSPPTTSHSRSKLRLQSRGAARRRAGRCLPPRPGRVGERRQAARRQVARPVQLNPAAVHRWRRGPPALRGSEPSPSPHRPKGIEPFGGLPTSGSLEVQSRRLGPNESNQRPRVTPGHSPD